MSIPESTPAPPMTVEYSNELPSDDNFDIIIESYRTAYDSNEFIFEWDPYEINTKEQLREEIQKIGHNYWGDHIVVQLLESGLDINFVILNTENNNIKNGTLKERRALGNSWS